MADEGQYGFDFATLQASPAWLTRNLRETGHLTRGRVADVSQERLDSTLRSHFFSLSLQYSREAEGECPARCLMKTSVAGRKDTVKEAVFYGKLAPLFDVPLLSCYGVEVAKDGSNAVLLLQDARSIPATNSAWPIPHGIDSSERAIHSLAQLHSAWWDSPALEKSGLKRVTTAAFERELAVFYQRVFPALCDRLGDALSPERRATIEALPDWYLPRFSDCLSRTAQTLLHGDAHLWNFLIPADPAQPAMLLDWSSWHVGVPTRDLAFAISYQWDAERRQRFEGRVLQHYHHALEAAGITSYPLGQFREDYRLSVALNILTPFIQAQSGTPPLTWWPALERAFSAFEEMDCQALAG